MGNNRIHGMFAALVGAVAALAAFAGPAAADVTVRHARGEIAVPEKPARVIVFDLASLDTLATLGVEGIVGVPSGNKPDYLADYAGGKVPEVGTLFEPNYEAVAAAEPDLIIVAGRSSAKYDDLAKIAPAIDLSIDAANHLESAKANIRTLATIFGKQDEAEALLGTLESSTAALKEKAADAGRTLFVLTTGGRMSSFGPGSRFGVLYSDFGFTPAATAPVDSSRPANHGQPVSFEYILETDPDLLVVLDRDTAVGSEGDAARKLLDNEIVARTKAWQEDKVIFVDPVLWYLAPGGLTSLQKTVDQLDAALSKG